MSQSSEHHHSGTHHSAGKSRRRRKLFSKRKLKKYAPVIIALIVFPAIVLGIHFWEEKVGADEQPVTAETVILPTEGSEEEELTFFNGNWYTPKKSLETTLLLGVDKNSDFVNGEGGVFEQADFLMLMVADAERKNYTAIPIHRDTMTEIQVLTDNGAPIRSTVSHISVAHTYGNRPEIGCKNTVRAVSGLLKGIQIDHYLSLTMDGVAVLNDQVGGVPVLVKDDFSGVDDTLVQGETVVLHGKHALTFIRARKSLGDGLNVGRMERQQQYMASLQAQFSRRADESEDFIMDTVMAISDYLVSDCTVDQLSAIIDDLHNFESEGVRPIEGEIVLEKYEEFYPDEQALRQLIMDVFYEKVDRT